MAHKPTYTRRLNSVEVAIWKNESEDAIWHNVTFQRVTGIHLAELTISRDGVRGTSTISLCANPALRNIC